METLIGILVIIIILSIAYKIGEVAIKIGCGLIIMIIIALVLIGTCAEENRTFTYQTGHNKKIINLKNDLGTQ